MIQQGEWSGGSDVVLWQMIHLNKQTVVVKDSFHSVKDGDRCRLWMGYDGSDDDGSDDDGSDDGDKEGGCLLVVAAVAVTE